MIPTKVGEHIRVTNPKNSFFRKYGVIVEAGTGYLADKLPDGYFEVILTNCMPPVYIPKDDMVVDNRWKRK